MPSHSFIERSEPEQNTAESYECRYFEPLCHACAAGPEY